MGPRTRYRTECEIRPLREPDLDAADRIQRRAFAALVGGDDQRDAELVRTRWAAGNTAALGAFAGPRLVGSVFATRWGSVGFVGPLSVEPECWDRGIGSQLMAAADGVLREWGVVRRGLFTFAHSPRHHRLYQRFGYWPRFLTALMSRSVPAAPPAVEWGVGSALDREELTAAAARLAGAVYPGLDIGGEIASVLDQKIGDVVLAGSSVAPTGVAVVHDGPGSEAGSGVAYVKVGLVRPGAEADFARLVDACLAHAAALGAERLVVGVNTARHRAYRHLVAHGFATDVPGVTMHAPNDAGYDRDDVFVIDDWR
ncbi:GNAT family N-acetyltransferase [Pseudonocardia kujensis]|uniref:GNAT family N-acetyltransferase n=1 Tax=Pseudonocardia kujensis TaxID=1128675 RepID=UPI001E5AAB3A|nr:GNAT family N-acetyltransferase [Pseudonocardia kujensis]MCE0766097.1 GNAT family N-acetyltransferase [Pseudonocardia kujensis]